MATAPVPAPIAGWMIAVLVRGEDEAQPAPRYFAIGQPDRARAEWAAVDAALRFGQVAASPVRGQEPVKAIAPLPAHTAQAMGLKPREVKALGARWPRRWIGSP